MLINSRFKMIVCDMAGTIIKENNIVYKTLYEVIKSFNDSLLQEDINKFKGYPAGFHAGHLKADLTSDEIQEMYKVQKG